MHSLGQVKPRFFCYPEFLNSTFVQYPSGQEGSTNTAESCRVNTRQTNTLHCCTLQKSEKQRKSNLNVSSATSQLLDFPLCCGPQWNKALIVFQQQSAAACTQVKNLRTFYPQCLCVLTVGCTNSIFHLGFIFSFQSFVSSPFTQ